MKTLQTWAGGSVFDYDGSVKTGTTIYYGKNKSYKKVVPQNIYANLICHFSGKIRELATSRTDRGKDSVGEWLKVNFTKTAITSYIGPILINEGYAQRVAKSSSQIEIF